MIHSARLTVSPVVNIVFAWNMFCFVRFWKAGTYGRTDIMCENYYPYRSWLWVGWVDQFLKEKSAKIIIYNLLFKASFFAKRYPQVSCQLEQSYMWGSIKFSSGGIPPSPPPPRCTHMIRVKTIDNIGCSSDKLEKLAKLALGCAKFLSFFLFSVVTFDPRGRPTVMLTIISRIVCTSVLPSVPTFQNLIKQNNCQARIVTAAGSGRVDHW